MSEIIKTRAIVLRRINFGDTSRIAHFFTEDFGKMSVMIKGARSPKSKIGSIVDTMNVVELILYKKENREIQLASQIDLVQYFLNIRDDLEKYKYASAIIELLSTLTVENEQHKKLFEGSIKILWMINKINSDAKLLFAKYFLFFLKEIGYEFQYKKCNICDRDINPGEEASYNYETGLFCTDCRTDRLTNFNFSKELLKLLLCLNSKKSEFPYNKNDLDKMITLLEKFLSYNVSEFKGIKSLKMNQ